MYVCDDLDTSDTICSGSLSIPCIIVFGVHRILRLELPCTFCYSGQRDQQ